MKQWAAILALLWVTATMQTAGERHLHPCRAEICAAVFSQPTSETHPVDHGPLLATSTLPGSSHLLGAAHDSGKGGRNTENAGTVAAHALDTHIRDYHLDTETYTLVSAPVSTHSTSRYIYFLRRIII